MLTGVTISVAPHGRRGGGADEGRLGVLLPGEAALGVAHRRLLRVQLLELGVRLGRLERCLVESILRFLNPTT